MSSGSAIARSGAVLVPIKSFGEAKGRLTPALDRSERALLARQMATHVLRAQTGVSLAVCCEDDEVAAWATAEGAKVIWCPGTGLIGAVQQGLSELRAEGVEFVAVAHGDLPLAESLDRLLGWPGVTLVPDRHRSGTNVITLPTDLDFEFQYGPGSFHRHVAEAVRLRRGMRIVHDAALGWDVDDPADLELPDQQIIASMLTSESRHDDAIQR